MARKHGTTEVATEYLKYFYGREGHEIIANNFYRPSDPEVAAKHDSQFPHLQLIKIDQFGGWNATQEKHFADDGVFDQIYGSGK